VRNARIIARIEGGLGNQMFIYAAARALALRTGAALRLDTGNGYRQDAYGRRYELDAFRIAAAPADPAEVARYAPGGRSFYWLRKLNRGLPFALRTVIEERALFEPRLLAWRPRGTVYLVGYWQREAYFREQADTIRRELTPRAEPGPDDAALAERLRATASVAVHVRRREYAHPLPPAYYAAAVRRLQARVADAQFHIFGDDLDWARRELHLPGAVTWATRPGAGGAARDLWLMSQCRHAIIANSSFSWWGAWLNPAPGRTVIAPATWGYRAAAADGWLTIDPAAAE
jgi:hypothetical protein